MSLLFQTAQVGTPIVTLSQEFKLCGGWLRRLMRASESQSITSCGSLSELLAQSVPFNYLDHGAESELVHMHRVHFPGRPACSVYIYNVEERLWYCSGCLGVSTRYSVACHRHTCPIERPACCVSSRQHACSMICTHYTPLPLET